MDIYLDVKSRGIYLALFSIYQISWIKMKKVTFCKLKMSLSRNFVYNLHTFREFCQVTALKHTYQLRGMASTLRMRTTISPGRWQTWTAQFRPCWGSSALHSRRVNERGLPRSWYVCFSAVTWYFVKCIFTILYAILAPIAKQ